ncbi:MAG: hypothetical protein CFE33_19535 [Pseudorhodobacter sp. PARRP1]|nr:MAG: hypothetical protein CFE33_19535 [Pseudorhodobacter sp. PARRP1]
MKPLTTHEEFSLKNAAHFVTARGRTPRDHTRQQFATLPDAQAFGATIRDGLTLIEPVRLTPAEIMIKSNDTCHLGDDAISLLESIGPAVGGPSTTASEELHDRSHQ